MWLNPQFPVDLVTFTEEILMENFIFCIVHDVFKTTWNYVNRILIYYKTSGFLSTWPFFNKNISNPYVS